MVTDTSKVTSPKQPSKRVLHRAATATVAGAAAVTLMATGVAHAGGTAHHAGAQPAAAVVTRSAGTGSFDKIANPARSIPASPSFYGTCATHGTNSAACISTTLEAINSARRDEGVQPMTLPSNFGSLSAVRQLSLVVQAERVDRGVRPLAGLSKVLDKAAASGASHRLDPRLTGSPSSLGNVRAWASNWAEDAGALGSDYDWMYDDGTGSSNIDCTANDHSGCWGHRENVLSNLPGTVNVAGIGESDLAGTPWQSWTVLLAGVSGRPHVAKLH